MFKKDNENKEKQGLFKKRKINSLSLKDIQFWYINLDIAVSTQVLMTMVLAI